MTKRCFTQPYRAYILLIWQVMNVKNDVLTLNLDCTVSVWLLSLMILPLGVFAHLPIVVSVSQGFCLV